MFFSISWMHCGTLSWAQFTMYQCVFDTHSFNLRWFIGGIGPGLSWHIYTQRWTQPVYWSCPLLTNFWNSVFQTMSKLNQSHPVLCLLRHRMDEVAHIQTQSIKRFITAGQMSYFTQVERLFSPLACAMGKRYVLYGFIKK